MTVEEIVGSHDYAIAYFEKLNCDSSTEEGQTVYSLKESRIVWATFMGSSGCRPYEKKREARRMKVEVIACHGVVTPKSQIVKDEAVETYPVMLGRKAQRPLRNAI